MNRSGYDDSCDDEWHWIMYRGRVASALRGKRGQGFLKECLRVLAGIPDQRLAAGGFSADGAYCVLGAVGAARGIDMAEWDALAEEGESGELAVRLSSGFDIAESLARELMYENDEGGPWRESPEHRWQRMVQWVREHIREPGESHGREVV